MFLAEVFDSGTNLLQNLACPRHLFFMRSSKLRWIGKWPVQPCGYTREQRAALRFGFTANCNYVRKQLTGFENVKDRLRPNARDIDPDFLKRFHHQRVKCSRLESGALCLEKLATNPVEKRRGHLAARAIMDANEKDVFLHKQMLNEREDESKPRLRVSQERHILTCLTIARPRPVPRMLSVLRALSTR
jgi:hypothetical protein